MPNDLTGQLIQQNGAVEAAPLQQETILFHPQSNQFCILNKTSSFIWNRMRSPVSAEQIAEELAATFSGITPDQALEDVKNAVSELVMLDLVVTRIPG